MIWSLPSETPSLCLSFDDGPIPQITSTVCEILDQYNAKATFFCVGENVKKYPREFELLLARGHSIGNHTNNHVNGWKTKTKEYFKIILEANEYI